MTLANIFTARLPSCVYSSLAVLAVFIWVAKASNLKIGILTAFVLMFEPYALKYGRIGILESLVILFAVLALYFLSTADPASGLRNYFLGGLFFGLALVSKELSWFLIIVLVLWLLLTHFVGKRKLNVLGTVAFVLIGLVAELFYVLWAISINASVFYATELNLVRRALWIIPNTGYSSANNISFSSDFMSTINIYLMSYALLVLALVSCVYLLLRDKSRIAIMLSSWVIGAFLFFGAIGIHNPQFFVYITVPAAVTTGYTLSKITFSLRKSRPVLSVLIMLLLLLPIFYNAGVWVSVDVISKDNAFSQSLVWVQKHIPAGAQIYVENSGYSYLLTNYNITVSSSAVNNVQAIQALKINYFIFSSQLNYESTNGLLSYVQTNGTLLASFYGESLGETSIYNLTVEG